MGHNSTVPIRIHEKYLQNIPKFGKYGPPCEERGKWIMEYGMLRLGPSAEPFVFLAYHVPRPLTKSLV